MSQIIKKLSVLEYIVIDEKGNIYRIKGDGDNGTIKFYKKNGKKALHTFKFPGYVKGEPGYWQTLKSAFDQACSSVENTLKFGLNSDDLEGPDKCAEEGWIWT